MSNWPLGPRGRLVDLGLAGGGGTTVTPLSAHTKTAWVELAAAAPCPLAGLYLHTVSGNTAGRTYLIDLGIGAAGAEQAIVEDLFVRWTASGQLSGGIHLPVAIAAGARIAIRLACNSTSSTAMEFGAIGIGADWTLPSGGTRLVGLNMDAANSRPANAALTIDNSWAEIVAATAERFAMIAPAIDHGSDSTRTAQPCTVELGIGAAGAEQAIATWLYRSSATACFAPDIAALVPCLVPPGSRIALRANAATTGDSLAAGLHAVSG